MFDDGVFEGDTIGTDKVRVDDEVVFGFEITDGHAFIPDFFGVGGFGSHTGDDGADQNSDNQDNANDSGCFFHGFPPSHDVRDIFHLLL